MKISIFSDCHCATLFPHKNACVFGVAEKLRFSCISRKKKCRAHETAGFGGAKKQGFLCLSKKKGVEHEN